MYSQIKINKINQDGLNLFIQESVQYDDITMMIIRANDASINRSNSSTSSDSKYA